MATQSIKNLILSQVEPILERAETAIREEGQKKVGELESKIPSTTDIFEKLKSEINKYACSPNGKAKLKRKYDQIDRTLTKVENMVGAAAETLENIKSKIEPIFDEQGQLKKLYDISKFLTDKIVPILQIALGLILAALAIQAGLTASGSSITLLSEKKVKIAGKIAEILAIGILVGTAVEHYKKEAEEKLNRINPPITLLKNIKEKVMNHKLFALGLLTFINEQCDISENTPNISTGNEGIPAPEENNSFNDYLNLLNRYYNETYELLKGLGVEKAVKREFALKENLEEDYNTSFKVITLN